ncbi:MAG: UDP-N-acetylmuramoyl-L-alanyl-D-glutamate--2,6-diaminopimelate ligase [Herminiimonas sp.]|nr:UDP-N-acetylmuramoyl-L-alanyl-D-glutamate--2,6-diaminopimelate ligase [Herminiimonas sp.]
MATSATPAERVADVLAWLAVTAPGAALSSDSRRIAPGEVFLAYAAASEDGRPADGRAFIADAIARGACAVIHDEHGFVWNPLWTVPHFGLADLHAVAGTLASLHYGQPDRTMACIAVTGTNGKTSCTQWLGAALSGSGVPTAVIGTFGIGLFEQGNSGPSAVTGYTTPDAVQLQRALADLRERGAVAVAIEASSIGLQQERMQGMHVDVALLTNLTRDHLDYHGDMAAYEAAKTRLFDWPGLQHAVINLDDAMGVRLVVHLRATAPAVQLIGYTRAAVRGASSVSEVANVLDISDLGPGGMLLRAGEIRGSHAGSQFQLTTVTADTNDTATTVAKISVKTQLVGDFNVSNVLGVLGVLLARGMPVAAAIASVEALQPVAGRMQQIGGPDQPLVVIDYAHTPDALEKTLASLRGLANDRAGELWCVFGCGGGRDPGKRPQMGAIAQAADHVIVTSDNPRSELPAAIIADIVAGIAADRAPQVIEDRATAILWALRHAGKHDVILLAGKGHENYQEIKGRKLQFLDADHAALALAARATMKGPH